MKGRERKGNIRVRILTISGFTAEYLPDMVEPF